MLRLLKAHHWLAAVQPVVTEIGLLLRRETFLCRLRSRRYAGALGQRFSELGADQVVDPDLRIVGLGRSGRQEGGMDPPQEAFLRMIARDRDALLLYAWGDLDYEGVARALGVPVGTVRSRLNRARRQLRQASGRLSSAKEVDHGRESGRTDAAPQGA